MRLANGVQRTGECTVADLRGVVVQGLWFPPPPQLSSAWAFSWASGQQSSNC